MKVFSIDEFTAQRRKAQDAAIATLQPLVEAWLADIADADGLDALISAAADLYVETYQQQGGEGSPDPVRFSDRLREALSKTTEESRAGTVATLIAVFTTNAATVQAAADDAEPLVLEWVTMHDDAVREVHKDAEGQQRPPGEMFDVGGEETPYPGFVTPTIENWINCRCTLAPLLAADATFRDVSPAERKKDAGAGRAMPDGSYPIDNCQDLRNAIQAIGRAKDPGKVKSHIKRRKSSLGCPDVSIPEGWALEGDEMPEEEIETAETPVEDVRVPWYGVMAPEGIRSGDGRRFKEGSLRARPLPLPLTWQKQSSEGHNSSVTVAKMERLARVGNEARSHGYFLMNSDADEVVGMIAEFGQYGVSVDADDATFDIAEGEEVIDFTDARICSACIVSIPAFAEAWVKLGEPPEDWYDGGEDLAGREEDPAMVAAAEFIDVAPGITEDGPGWLTHPVDTDRLRDYWVRGEGAAKIAWGTPGDFNRCRLSLAEYVKPQYLSGYCANRHFDALGIWPGEHAGELAQREGEMADAVTLVAGGGFCAPSTWFDDPKLDGPTHLSITEEGRVFGHIAEWGTCHIGYEGVCVEPPRSPSGYARYATGRVLLDNGEMAHTGVLSLGGGHAGPRLRPRAAIEHYDSTSAAVADVAVGEDEHGIWCAGWIRPGTTDEQVTALRASDVSGDWREFGGELDMVAALACNVGGFQVACRVENGVQMALTAAGIVPVTDEEDPVEALAEQIAVRLEQRQYRRERMQALVARVGGQ